MSQKKVGCESNTMTVEQLIYNIMYLYNKNNINNQDFISAVFKLIEANFNNK